MPSNILATSVSVNIVTVSVDTDTVALVKSL